MLEEMLDCAVDDPSDDRGISESESAQYGSSRRIKHPFEEDTSEVASAAGNSLAKYLKEIARFPLLSPEQEIEFSKELEYAHLQILYRMCRYRRKTPMPPSFPGLALLEIDLKSAFEDEATLEEYLRLKSSLENDKKPELESIARSIFAMIPEPRYDTIRSAAGYLIQHEPEPRKKKDQETLSMISEARSRALRIREEFVSSNLRMVVSMAKKYRNKGLPFADLIQEGNLGLFAAVERFDHKRGYRFSTYATWWIRHSLQRALFDKGRMIRLPVHMQEYLKSITKKTAELIKELGRPPEHEEVLRAYLGEEPSAKEVLKYRQIMMLPDVISYDQQISDEGSHSMEYFIEDRSAEHPVQGLIQEESVETLMSTLGDERLLSPIELAIIQARFLADETKTLRQIGDEYKLSRERIRQIQEHALRKLNKALCKSDVFFYDA